MDILGKRSLTEINSRLEQSIWNMFDRYRFRNGSIRFVPEQAPKAKCGHIKFFINPVELEDTIQTLKQNFPDSVERILEEAEGICRHRFNVLGYRDLSWEDGGKINWHFDPVNKKESPKIWWQKIDCSNNQLVGDPKVVWELNRHQYFLILAKAYLLSGDKKYKKEFIGQLQSWFLSNPPKIGINWTSSLELAYRSIAWIWAYHLFNGGEEFPKEFLSQFIVFLALQAEHIEHNLSTYFSPNTHLTGEALGLFYIGFFLSDFKDSKKWVNIGKEILLEELHKQVLSDGGYIEHSLWYHRYTLEIYLHFHLLAKLNNIELPKDVEQGLERLAEFLLYSSRPDRTFPQIGDDDGGRLLPLDTLQGNDLRGLFSTLSVVFKRGDFKKISEGYQEETLWLLGPESQKIYLEVAEAFPRHASKAFPSAGFFYLRDGWLRDSSYLALSCNTRNWLRGGHAHSDSLSIEVFFKGGPIIIDPGTYRYSTSDQWRNYFRATSSHNTVLLNKNGPDEIDGPFSWQTKVTCEVLNWIETPKLDIFEGKHSGFRLGNEVVTHRRRVLFAKSGFWLVEDFLEGSGENVALDFIFQLFPTEAEIDLATKSVKIRVNNNNHAFIMPLVKGGMEVEILEGYHSTIYGRKEKAPKIRFRYFGKIPRRFLTLIYPYRNSIPLIKTIQGDGGISDSIVIQLEEGRGSSFFVIRGKDFVYLEGLKTDAEFVWLKKKDGAFDSVCLIHFKEATLSEGISLFSKGNTKSLTLTRDDIYLRMLTDAFDGEISVLLSGIRGVYLNEAGLLQLSQTGSIRVRV